MERRAFVKSGALALVTMGLSPSFLRRTAFGAELLGGAAATLAMADGLDVERAVFIAHEVEGQSFKSMAAETGAALTGSVASLENGTGAVLSAAAR